MLSTSVVHKTTLAARGGPSVVSSTTVVHNTTFAAHLGPTLQCRRSTTPEPQHGFTADQVARERHAEWMERMLGGALAREDAWLVRLVSDGLWYSDLLGIAAPQGDDRRRLIELLPALAAGGAG